MAGAGEEIQVKVEGIGLLERKFTMVDRGVRNGMRREIRAAGKPVSALARSLALGSISHMPRSPRWARMKIGIDAGTVAGIYMVPSSKRAGGSGRSNLKGLLMDKSMQPAVEAMRPAIISALEKMIDEEVHTFG